jgi:hypothetical protein
MYLFSTLHRYTEPKRFSSKWLKKQELLAEIRKAKVKRLGNSCQINSPVCTKRATCLHHVGKRSQFGAAGDTDENTRLSCRPCNRYIERFPAWALKHGFTKRRSS